MLSSDPRFKTLLSLAQTVDKVEDFNQTLIRATKNNPLKLEQLQKFNRDQELFQLIAKLNITMGLASAWKVSSKHSVEELILKLSFHFQLKKQWINTEIYACLSNIFQSLEPAQFKTLKLSLLAKIFQPTELILLQNKMFGAPSNKKRPLLSRKLNLLKIELQNFKTEPLTNSPLEENTSQETFISDTDALEDIEISKQMLQAFYTMLVNESAYVAREYLIKHKNQLSIALKNTILNSSEEQLFETKHLHALDQLCLYIITIPYHDNDGVISDCRNLLLNMILSSLDDTQKVILGNNLITYIKNEHILENYYSLVFGRNISNKKYINKFLSIVADFFPDLTSTQDNSHATDDVNVQPLQRLYDKLLSASRRHATIYETYEFVVLNKDLIQNEANHFNLLDPSLLEKDTSYLSSLEQLILFLLVIPIKSKRERKTANTQSIDKKLMILECILNSISAEKQIKLLIKLWADVDHKKFISDFYSKFFNKKYITLYKNRISKIKQSLLNSYNNQLLKILTLGTIAHTEEHCYILDLCKCNSANVQNIESLRQDFLLMSLNDSETSIERVLLHLTLSLVKKDVVNLEDKTPQSEFQIIRFNQLIQDFMGDIVNILDLTELLLLQLSLQGKAYELIQNHLQTIGAPIVSREVLEDQMLYLDTLLSKRIKSLEMESSDFPLQMQANNAFTSTAQVYSTLAVNDSSIADAIDEATGMRHAPNTLPMQVAASYCHHYFQPAPLCAENESALYYDGYSLDYPPRM